MHYQNYKLGFSLLKFVYLGFLLGVTKYLFIVWYVLIHQLMFLCLDYYLNLLLIFSFSILFFFFL